MKPSPSNTIVSPSSRGPLRAIPLLWPLVLVVVGAILIGSSAIIAPFYIGLSGHVPGVVVDSPTSHAVVSYEVDGATYTVKTTHNDPSWQTGREVTVAYNPRHPDQATLDSGRWVVVIFSGLGGIAVVIGLVLGAGTLWRQWRARWLLTHGHRVEGEIVRVNQNAAVHLPTKWSTTVTCRWQSPDHAWHKGTSLPRFMPIGITVRQLPVTTLPVYVDVDHPGRYYVDDSVLAAR